jgi:hypothetical protein
LGAQDQPFSGSWRMSWKSRARWLSVLATVGCGGTTAPDVFAPDAGADALAPDGEPTGPFDSTIASSPPIELPGTVLWLDGNFGVARASAEVRAWTDRSGFGHVFEREAVGDPTPAPDRLANQGALRFGGHSRMVLSKATDEKGRAALTIGSQDFLIALVLRRDPGRPSEVLFALSPWIDPLSVPAPDAALYLQLEPTLQLGLFGRGHAEGGRLEAPGLIEAGKPHLVLISSQGPMLTARIDGRDVASKPLGRLGGERADGKPLELPFLPPFVGEWDFDLPGLTGLVGEVVMVVGPGVPAATEPLELYLRKKYGI